MANVCEVTGKRKLKGNRVSHANNKTTHFQQPNIQEKRIHVPELGQDIRLSVTTRGLRTLDKVGGVARFVISKKADELSPTLRRVRKLLFKKKYF